MSTFSPETGAVARTWRDLVVPAGIILLLASMTASMSLDLLLTRAERGWVSHSRDVIEKAQSLYASAVQVESAQRGFAFTGDPGFLRHFDSDAEAVAGKAAGLRVLVSDNPPQSARANRLISALSQRVALSRHRVELYRAGRQTEARTANAGQGLALMEQARGDLAELMRAEDDLLAAREARARRYEWTGFIVALALSGLAALGLATQMLLMARANRDLRRAIGERQAAESSQRESEARYRAIFANTADLLSVIDVSPDGVFRMGELNPAYERATGVTTDMVRGVEVRFMAREPDSSRLVEHLRRVVSGGAPVFTRDPVTLGGGRRIWESIMVPLRNDEGRVDRIVASSRDVTEREESQERLRRAQRMEAVGHLTGGVAHDFNNILQIIRGNLEMIAGAVSDPEATERLKNALHGADRAAGLTRQLLAFARRQPLEPRVVNLGRLVSDMAEMLRRTLGEGIEVETVVAGGLWNTLADPSQVESAVLNLALNARDAMSGGGRLTIEITNAVLDERYVGQEREVEPGQYVMLAVTDTGHGMSEETLSRAFEPFFTTKGEERGTGLGLSMVYGFVKQSHGHVQIYSEPNEGTTVKIYLPRATQAPAAALVEAETALAGEQEVILVVEDDDLVRVSTVSMLRDMGYNCVHASDGADALDKLRAGLRPDLLFTDVIMPGPVKSRELAREAEAMHPGLPVLFTSGYSENAIVHQGRLDEGVQLLSKPFSREDLGRKIRSMLHKPQRVVLVVEDDVLVRMAAVDMVESLGFATAQAGDGEEALGLISAGERIDILFTDIGLPGIRGPELATRALALKPDLKVVFASGYGETAEAQSVPGAAHLDKPYEQAKLAEILGLAAPA